jgi:hypothetical protein
MNLIIIIIIFIIILYFLYKKHQSEKFDNLVTVDDTIYGRFTCFSEDQHICLSLIHISEPTRQP